jgi:hypothetical protein
MKKIISLLVSVCALASVFTTAAYAADVPTVDVKINKISFADEAYAKHASKYDWSEYNSDAVGGSYDTYSVKIVASGLSQLEAVDTKVGRNTVSAGTSMTGYQFTYDVVTEGLEYNLDWQAGTIAEFGGNATDTAKADKIAAVYTGVAALLPEPGVSRKVANDEEVELVEFLVTVDSGKPVTFDFNEALIFYGEYADTTGNPSKQNNIALTPAQASFTVPPVEDEPIVPPVEDDTLKITISDPMAIKAGDVNGIAWDVAFENFDSTKEYRAFFTSNGVERNPAGQRIEFDIETEADFGFAAILNKVQLGAEDTVDFEIKY